MTSSSFFCGGWTIQSQFRQMNLMQCNIMFLTAQFCFVAPSHISGLNKIMFSHRILICVWSRSELQGWKVPGTVFFSSSFGLIQVKVHYSHQRKLRQNQSNALSGWQRCMWLCVNKGVWAIINSIWQAFNLKVIMDPLLTLCWHLVVSFYVLTNRCQSTKVPSSKTASGVQL